MADTKKTETKKEAPKKPTNPKYVNPIISWSCFAGALVIAIVIGLVVLL